MDIDDCQYLMDLALEEAEKAYRKNEVPVGALLADRDGKILAKTHNLKEGAHDPCGHAEILAIIQAANKLGCWRLAGCHLLATLEPCPMCLAAAGQARLARVTFGAYDPKGGALSLGYNFHSDGRLNHRFAVAGGIRHYRCAALLSRFFKEKRRFYKHCP